MPGREKSKILASICASRITARGLSRVRSFPISLPEDQDWLSRRGLSYYRFYISFYFPSRASLEVLLRGVEIKCNCQLLGHMCRQI